MDDRSLALVELGRALARSGYQFVTPTPETHRRVVARHARARDLRDVFGWSLPFERELVPRALLELLLAADAALASGELLRSRVRFSTLQDALYAHSAYPTTHPDAVFFGPDTYRFCAYVARAARASDAAPRALCDLGCGTGAGGLVAAKVSGAARVVLADVNRRALELTSVNARLAGREVELVESDLFARIEGEFDLIVANPPYMRDDAGRTYRDGGGPFGEALSLRIVREALPRLASGGALLLYTGAAVVDGEDVFWRAVSGLVRDLPHQYEELDPDVFGEELERPGYEHVERIAAVALTVRRK